MIDQRTAPYAALLLRVTIAGLFIAALYGKFILKPISLWWNGLLKAGYPEWVLAYALSAEFASAVLLLLGVYTRWVSLYTLPMMMGATHFWMVRKSFWFVEGGMGNAFRLGRHAAHPSAAGRWCFRAEGTQAALGRAA
jgi:putative oxidoreductase